MYAFCRWGFAAATWSSSPKTWPTSSRLCPKASGCSWSFHPCSSSLWYLTSAGWQYSVYWLKSPTYWHLQSFTGSTLNTCTWLKLPPEKRWERMEWMQFNCLLYFCSCRFHLTASHSFSARLCTASRAQGWFLAWNSRSHLTDDTTSKSTLSAQLDASPHFILGIVSTWPRLNMTSKKYTLLDS